jgi:hypothetical protein
MPRAQNPGHEGRVMTVDRAAVRGLLNDAPDRAAALAAPGG